jgi:hypothetical protein
MGSGAGSPPWPPGRPIHPPIVSLGKPLRPGGERFWCVMMLCVPRDGIEGYFLAIRWFAAACRREGFAPGSGSRRSIGEPMQRVTFAGASMTVWG